MSHHAPMSDRIALVTGASRGIGHAVTKSFAKAGATVIAVARTQGALEELDTEVQSYGLPPLVLAPMDVTDANSMDELARAIGHRFGRLDVLVSCAATLGGLRPLAHFEPKTFDNVIQTNITANWRLIRNCDLLLRQSDAGRGIFVTSEVTQAIPAYFGGYTAAKTALEAMVKTYAAELAQTNVRVNLLDPGAVRTRMRAEAFPGEDPLTLPTPDTITHLFHELACPKCSLNGSTVFAAP